MNNMKDVFRKAFSFNGRIRRKEYGISMIIYAALYILLLISMKYTGPLLGVVFIPMIWFLWAQGAKRCHDVGKNGFWQIIPFYFLILLFVDGEPYDNQYGANPKDPVKMSWDFDAQNFDSSQPGTFPPPIQDVVPVTDDGDQG